MKFIRFLLGTSIIWLPIVLSIITKKLAEVITIEATMTIVYIAMPVLLIALLRINNLERKEMKKNVRKNCYQARRKNITAR